MNSEAIERRRKALNQQLAQQVTHINQLDKDMRDTQALINGVEGALLDCDYWLQQLNTFDETAKNGEAQDGK